MRQHVLRNLRHALPIGLTFATTIAQAQVGTSITFFGNMSLSDGSTGTAMGQATQTLAGLSGGAIFTFASGPITELRLTEVREYNVPGSTAFLGGPAIAILNGGARQQKVAGRLFIMVDDLNPSNLPFPDQIFIRFDSNDGRTTFVRHGLITRGDIRVSF